MTPRCTHPGCRGTDGKPLKAIACVGRTETRTLYCSDHAPIYGFCSLCGQWKGRNEIKVCANCVNAMHAALTAFPVTNK